MIPCWCFNVWCRMSSEFSSPRKRKQWWKWLVPKMFYRGRTQIVQKLGINLIVTQGFRSLASILIEIQQILIYFFLFSVAHHVSPQRRGRTWLGTTGQQRRCFQTLVHTEAPDCPKEWSVETISLVNPAAF